MNKFYKNIFKYLSILLLLIILIFSISGSYSYKNIDNLAYVVALGIDKGTSNTLKLTIQLSKPTSSESSSSSSQSTSSVINSVECSTIESRYKLI